MGSIRRLDGNADPQAFPGAKFEIVGDVPAPQCSEARVEGTGAQIDAGLEWIYQPGKFVGWVFTGKKVTVTSPLANAGTYNITGWNDNFIYTDTIFAEDTNEAEYYVHNGGSLILTRDVASFAAYIHAAGYAYTIKGGKLYTNMPNGQLKEACTIEWDPIT